MWLRQRGPVLRVLRAVLGAHRDAQHHGHVQLAGRHGLPLRELVEDLVAGAAHEVGVHQLGHHPAAFQRVAHRRADNGGFGDRRVEQPVVGQRFGQAAIDGEGAAPIAILLAEGDHRRVDREPVEHGLEEAVADVVRLHLRDGLAVLGRGVRIFALICCTRGFSAEVLQELGLAARRASPPAGWRT